MILSFFTQKSTRSAKVSSVFAERFSGEGQADFAINKAHKVSLKGRNNLYISCVFNGFKYIFLYSKTGVYRGIPIFLFLLQNIDCVYSLEPPRRGGSNVYPQSMF